MSQKVIVLGDKTSHGGAVISGAPTQAIAGKPIARVGDQVSCPVHGNNPIVQGHPTLTIEGVPVALHGHVTACGSTLIGSVTTDVA